MSRFCDECGAQLTTEGKFCGSCGKPVTHLCPTCGQTWDPLAAASKVEKQALSTSSPVPAATTPSAISASKPDTKILSNARVLPIYGSKFVEGKDCPNCGTKGMANKTCTTCESEN